MENVHVEEPFVRVCCCVPRHVPYPNLYPDQSPSEDWTMEERFRALTFHGLILRSQLVNLLIRGVCYAENQSVSLCVFARVCVFLMLITLPVVH